MNPLLLTALLLLPQVDTLPVPDAYRAALEAGTRTRTGAPGPAYWTNTVEYAIETAIDPASARVSGSEVIRYHNRSPHELRQVALNLGQNVFAPGNPRNRSVPVTGGFALGRIVLQGTPVTHLPFNPGVGTTHLLLPLPDAVPPGGSFQVEIDWSFEVPEGTFRMGREAREVYYLAQWYPQIAVYDDLHGWARAPYLGDGEFYLDYGTFDVRISAPVGWLVSASGELQNPDEVLTAPARARLAELAPDRITHVVTRDDRDQGRMTASSATGTLTWHYRAEDVRDFAWGTSDRYVWDATLASWTGPDGEPGTSRIHTFYRPEQPQWDRSAEYARHAIENHSYWYSYPWPQMTVNEGVIGGGMEYPMITIIGGGRTPESLYGVIAHELGHMWWPMVVGTNEKAHAWMDEGLASFAEDRTAPMLFPELDAGLNTMNGYLRVAGQDVETESMRPADLYGPFGNRGLASYGKPATGFRMLRFILGAETFDRALREYTRRWAFKHPHPLDLFWTFEDVSGQDLDGFFHAWMYTTRVIDQAVASVETRDGRARVVLEDRGEIPMPVHLVLETGDGGAPVVVDAPAGRWDGKRLILEVVVPAPVTRAVLDPDQWLADVDRANNTWMAR